MTDERVALFVGQRVDRIIVPPFTAMGIEKGGEVVAGVVFNGFTRSNIEVTIAGNPGAFTRGFIHDVGLYVFEQLGCERITVRTDQPTVVRIAERLGGQVEGVLRNHFGKNRNATIIGILRDDWRF